MNLQSTPPNLDPDQSVDFFPVPVPAEPPEGPQQISQRLDETEGLVLAEIKNNPRFDAGPQLKKLIIQIPCYNEAETLGITLSALPRMIAGIEKVEWLIIDDGSRDQTVEVAKQFGVDHIVKLPRNQGLARAFMEGINEAIRLGADIIVNTDADNQYCADDIQTLVDPILNGQAELVIGQRPIAETPHFSRIKKILQRFGSWVVRQVSNAEVADAPSGFRAMTRATAKQLNVFSDYSYTLETIIQAGHKNMAVKSVPIRTNPDLRPSRLFKSIPGYVSRSGMTIIRIFMAYRPFHFFAVPGLACCLAGAFLWCRFIYYFVTAAGVGHIQSLILGSLLVGMGVASIVVGLVADLISVNRKLLEKVDWHVRELSETLNQQQSELARISGTQTASSLAKLETPNAAGQTASEQTANLGDEDMA